MTNVENTFYIIGTVAGPHPYPLAGPRFSVGDRQRGQAQIAGAAEGRLPDTLVACIGGGSNAMGLFHPFLDDEGVRIDGVEAMAGLRRRDSGRARRLAGRRRPGVLHGNRTYLLQDDDGQITEAHSISAGLDYPGIGPEHAWLKDDRPGDLCLGDRRGGAGGVSAAAPGNSRASFRRWSRRMRWPGSMKLAPDHAR